MTRAHLSQFVSIERARPEDWSQIEELLRARALPLEGAKEHLSEFLVALDSGTVLGTAALEVYGADGLLRSVAVQEHLAGRGLGTALVKAALARAESLGLRELYLLTTTAADYFERHGFKRISIQDVPSALSASQELRGACPASATVMRSVRGA
jgi:N-acetylglutamate synthase-like GNAT family acetyltransferase